MKNDYATKRIHPVTGILKRCIAIPDHFKENEHGYRFTGEKLIYTEEDLREKVPPKPYPDG